LGIEQQKTMVLLFYWLKPKNGYQQVVSYEDRLTASIGGKYRNIIIPEFKAGSYYNQRQRNGCFV
jgi:hypothetical protein